MHVASRKSLLPMSGLAVAHAEPQVEAAATSSKLCGELSRDLVQFQSTIGMYSNLTGVRYSLHSIPGHWCGSTSGP